jgi:hypothetical protein
MESLTLELFLSKYGMNSILFIFWPTGEQAEFDDMEAGDKVFVELLVDDFVKLVEVVKY